MVEQEIHEAGAKKQKKHAGDAVETAGVYPTNEAKKTEDTKIPQEGAAVNTSDAPTMEDEDKEDAKAVKPEETEEIHEAGSKNP